MNSKKIKATFALLPATLALLAPAMLTQPAQAGILHRHPHMASIAAGIAAHHMAKHSGRTGHKNFAQRHPIMSGMAAGMATHHILKRH